ncbi:MAG TPA: LCP family protein [Miltoncostaeaceae bacterium]|nr:LCP family protein [Miltoncostaeaceae bacterium]
MSILEPPPVAPPEEQTAGAGPPELPPDHRDATYYRMPRRRRPWFTVLAWVVVLAVGSAAAAALYAAKLADRALSNPANDTVAIRQARKILDPHLPGRPYNVLIIGSDKRPGRQGAGDNGRSDTLILVRLDFKAGFISMLSFPRDLYVPIPGHGQNKINSAFSFGGPKLTVETVRQLTGEPINNFFNIDFKAFVQLVNNTGGIYLDVDRRYFNDNSGPGPSYAKINIQPGYQLLNGDNALDYVRFRHTDSDFARIVRQQAFLSELKRQTNGLSGLNNIVDAIHDNVTTDLRSTSKLKDFLEFAFTTEKERIARIRIDGHVTSTAAGASIVEASQREMLDKLDEWKNPVFVTGGGPVRSRKPAATTVAVYNGGGRLLAGRDAALDLAGKGYQAFTGGNAPDGTYANTAVFYAPGWRNEAKVVQGLFGASASIAPRRAGQPRAANVNVMIGADWAGSLARPPKVQAVKQRPDTVGTTSLARLIRNARSLTGMPLLVPTHVPRGAHVARYRLYNVVRGDRGKPNAFVIVFRLPRGSQIGPYSYVTIMQTSLKSPPLVRGRTGVDRQGNSTFYDGKNMQRLLWQRGRMTYWITNSLDEDLTVETIRDMRTNMLLPGKVHVRKGHDTAIVVHQDEVTP